MKLEEKKLARKLREQGWSINDIYRRLGVGKSSVSLWVRNIELTPKQKHSLSTRGISKEVIERRRNTRLTNEDARRQIIIDTAKGDIHSISEQNLHLIGTALYWAEGSKSSRGVVQLSNGDPKLIQVMMRFFREICEVPEQKFRGHIFLHPHLSATRAKRYWHNVSGIPSKQFYKTSQQHNKASKGKKDSLPFGTFNIEICNTELLLKLKGWTEKIHELAITNNNGV